MSPAVIFNLHLVLGYVPWLLICGAYVWPWLWSLDRIAAHRVIAALNSFRFFGLVFILPGVVGPGLPTDFGAFAAYGDFATGILAMLALATIRYRLVFMGFVVAFNIAGAVDIAMDYLHGVQLGIPFIAGQFGATYGIVMIYVPLLLISNGTALALILRPNRTAVPARA